MSLFSQSCSMFFFYTRTRIAVLLHLLYWADLSWSCAVLDAICTSILESCIYASPHLHWSFHLHLCDSCGTHGYYWETDFWPVSMKTWYLWVGCIVTALMYIFCLSYPGATRSTRTLLQRPHLSTLLACSWWSLGGSSSSLSLRHLGNGLLNRSCTTPLAESKDAETCHNCLKK